MEEDVNLGTSPFQWLGIACVYTLYPSRVSLVLRVNVVVEGLVETPFRRAVCRHWPPAPATKQICRGQNPYKLQMLNYYSLYTPAGDSSPATPP